MSFDVVQWSLQLIHGISTGVTKTHKFSYEAVEAMHALFDSTRATNTWQIHARMLREYIEFFGARTEQLDMFLEDDRFTFTSYTEKIVHNKGNDAAIFHDFPCRMLLADLSHHLEILKAPLQTSISLSPLDFPHFSITDSLHIAIAVSDFKTMVLHATTLNALVSCAYSVPLRPLQFNYTAPGMRCEFTLTTIGSGEGAATSAALAKEVGSRRPRPHAETPVGASRAASVTTIQHSEPGSLPPPRSSQREMPPPSSVPASRLQSSRGARLGSNLNAPEPSQRSAAVTANQDDEGLFWPDNDVENEDRKWGTMEEREEEDALGWAQGADNEDEVPPRGTFRDINSAARPSASSRREFDETGESFIAPTQRAADVKGLFDD